MSVDAAAGAWARVLLCVGVASAAGTAACTAETPGQRAVLRGGAAVALACLKDGTGRPLEDCRPAEAQAGSLVAGPGLHALVLNRDHGELAVLNVVASGYLDAVPQVPGLTHVPVGDAPVAVATARDGRFAYVLNAGAESISFVDLAGLCEAGVLPLRGSPASMLLDPAGAMYVAYPDTAEVAVIDLDDCDAEVGVCAAGRIAPEVRTRAGADGTVGPQPPACGNGRDDDGDGLFDAADPGCATGDDDDEGDGPAVAARCSDGVDNDGDGLTDLEDPGCTRASDDGESDDYPPMGTAAPPACFDGLDNDGDGRTDWPADPGCAAAGDADEAPAATACLDGVDNDDEGGPDGEDPGCTSPDDESEAGCDDGTRILLTRPGQQGGSGTPVALALSSDGRTLYVGHADRSYVSVVDVARGEVVGEVGVAAGCSNDLDDDGDGRTDFPDDPECSGLLDDDEAAGAAARQCDDGRDNDGNGLVDLADPGCEGPGDPVEMAPPLAARCHNGLDDDGDGLVDLLDPGCRHEDDVDERDPDADPAVLPQCADGVDNDADGRVDLEDDGCAAAGDEVEAGPPVDVSAGGVMPCEEAAQGEVAGCAGPGDLRHLAPGEAPAAAARVQAPPVEGQAPPGCSDGVDNDGDGLADFPDDPDCAAGVADDEFRVFGLPACAGLWPNDPDCAAAGDPTADPATPACSDGVDNDGDGLVDAAADPGCEGADGDAEDAVVQDAAGGPDCGPADRSPARTGDTEAPARRGLLWCPPEADPALDPPHCNDGRDNDRDGLVDADDPGCASAWDGDEVGVGPQAPECPLDRSPACGGFVGGVRDGGRPPACADGLDNDGDGATDPRDDGRCISPLDDSEAGPAGFPWLGGAEVLADADQRGDEAGPFFGLRAGVAALAVTPDGTALYALDRGFGWVAVVDLATGRLVDTRAQQPFHVSKGFDVPGVPVAIAFACFAVGEPETCGVHSPDVLALVTGTEGEVRVFRARQDGVAVHRVEDGSAALRTVAERPAAFRPDGSVVPALAAAPPEGQPFTGRSAGTFGAGGAMGVIPAGERGPTDVSGVAYGRESVTDATWTATWEGELPGSSRVTGRLRAAAAPADAGDATPPASGVVVLEDPDADFCGIGVTAGDHVVVTTPLALDDVPEAARPACDRVFSAEALVGRQGPEWCVTDVRPHSLALRALPRRLPEGVRRAPGVCPLASPGNVLDPLPAGAPLAECFGTFVRYVVRASEEFVVAQGGASRIEHNSRSSGGRCEPRPDAHPLRRGRARLCDPAAKASDLTPGDPCVAFENRDLTMTLFAPSDPEAVPQRGAGVRIKLLGGTSPLSYRLGTLTAGISVDPGTGRAYVIEAGFEELWLIDPRSPSSAVVLGR